MNKETMSLHKALCELKIIDKRIDDKIAECAFVGMTKSAIKMVGAQTVAEFIATQKSLHESINDLIKRRTAIKNAVVLSNAQTKVTIGGKEYTVAEAIEMKNHGLDAKRTMLRCMVSALKTTEHKVSMTNDTAERNADIFVKDTFGSKDVKSAEVMEARAKYLDNQKVELVDPLDIRKEIEKLDEEIDSFMIEVDSALSVSNARTEIEIEY